MNWRQDSRYPSVFPDQVEVVLWEPSDAEGHTCVGPDQLERIQRSGARAIFCELAKHLASRVSERQSIYCSPLSKDGPGRV